MRLTSLLKMAMGTGAALLVFTVAPATTASAAPPTFVPCSSGAAGLIAAINAANGSGGGTISLAWGCTYVLPTTPNNGENGLPVVTSSINVYGNNATITGSNAVRIFEVDGPGGNLSLQNVTLTGGTASDFGGAIFNSSGTVTLNQSVVTGNSAGKAGGGIASGTLGSNTASLTLNGSVVTNNSGGVGGGIVNLQGNATLNFSRVANNFAGGPAGGGIASGDYNMGPFSPGPTSQLTLNFSQVNNNTAPNAGGGGIQNLAGDVTLNVSQVNGNTSLNGGGISSGNGNGGAPGGAPPGTSSLTVFFSQVNGNTSTAPVPMGPMAGPPIAAGGIANGGTAVLFASEVDNNTATTTSGAGIVNHGTMTINFSAVNHNTAAGTGGTASGGGIVNASVGPGTNPPSGFLTINFSQVNGNSAGGFGGGILNGLPSLAATGTLTMSHSQVIGNSATLGGGGIYSVTGGVVSLTSTFVIGNHPDNIQT